MNDYSIEHAAKADLNFIYRLFEEAISYQKRRGFPVWVTYDRDVIDRDIETKNLYKILIGNEIACIFSVCYTDRVIWREKDRGDAVYLHRIVVNPDFKGQKQFGKILDWAISHAKGKKLHFVRMDTWADNSNIINYYTGFGFQFVENYTTPDSPELSIQARGLSLALLEMKL